MLEIRSVIGDEDGLVRPGDVISYEATLENRLRDRYALGLFETDLPVALQNADLDPQVFELGPADPNPLTQPEVVTIAGQVTVGPAISVSQQISLTNQAGAIIADLRAEAAGRVLWLHLDEAGLFAQTYRDDSLLGHAATCVGNGPGCPGSGRTGYMGRALEFDGVNDRATVPDNVLGTKRNDFAIMAWIRPDRVTGRQRLISNLRTSSGNNGFGLGLDRDRLLFTLYGVVDYLTDPLGLEPGKWYHVAAVLDSLNSTFLYLNGQLVGAWFPESANANADDGWILGALSPTTELYDGLMDEVEIYDHALSAQEIAERFNAPVLHLQLDEGAGANVFADESPLGNRVTCGGAVCPTSIEGRSGRAVAFN
ncbi:MAG: LamG domain-containing protein, partial [Ardenticatenaceae bacterium]